MSTVINDVEGVPKTFSNWDTCMAKAYCKYVDRPLCLSRCDARAGGG